MKNFTSPPKTRGPARNVALAGRGGGATGAAAQGNQARPEAACAGNPPVEPAPCGLSHWKSRRRRRRR